MPHEEATESCSLLLFTTARHRILHLLYSLKKDEQKNKKRMKNTSLQLTLHPLG